MTPELSERLFDRVFVRPPPDDYELCHTTNPARNDIDVVLARSQHREYVSILKQHGIEVVALPVLDGFPDSVFVQDPGIVGCSASLAGRFGLKSRRGEESALVDDVTNTKIFVGSWRHTQPPGCLEGGDVLVTERGLLAGSSGRNNLEGVRQLQKCWPGLIVKSLRANTFHLLSCCSYLGNNTILASSHVSGMPFQDFKLIEVARSEEYAANVAYLGEGKVLMPDGYVRTRARLKEAGYVPVELDNSEFWKGDGAITCLSSPVYQVL